jgi:hypothetical protein
MCKFLSRRDILSNSSFLGLISNEVTNPNSKEISLRQKAIVIGNTLGDGFLQLSNNGKKSRLRFTHGIKQKDYAKWQYDQIKDPLCIGVGSKVVKQPYETKTKQGYVEMIGYTAYREELLDYHDLFYEKTENTKYKKKIRPELVEYLKDPTSLMVWYLDDGTLRGDSNACRLATQSFSLDEHHILEHCLDKNFGIKSNTVRWSTDSRNKVTFGLNIPAKNHNSEKFLKLFSDVVIKEIPSMSYKVVLEKQR